MPKPTYSDGTPKFNKRWNPDTAQFEERPDEEEELPPIQTYEEWSRQKWDDEISQVRQTRHQPERTYLDSQRNYTSDDTRNNIYGYGIIALVVICLLLLALHQWGVIR